MKYYIPTYRNINSIGANGQCADGSGAAHDGTCSAGEDQAIATCNVGHAANTSCAEGDAADGECAVGNNEATGCSVGNGATG